jgi:hypothetical protein
LFSLRGLHVFASSLLAADVPKAGTECSGFTVSWAKILLSPAEGEARYTNPLDPKSVLVSLPEQALR